MYNIHINRYKYCFQLRFNHAIRTLTQDKERVIEDLRLRVHLLTDESEKLGRLLSKAAEESSEHLVKQMTKEIESLKVVKKKFLFIPTKLEI